MITRREIRTTAVGLAVIVALLLFEAPNWLGTEQVAEGQGTTVTLLSNFNVNAATVATAVDITLVGYADTTNYKKSGSFTTGSNPAGYIAENLTFKLLSILGEDTSGVAIHEDDENGNPVTNPLHTFSRPSSFPSISTGSYTDVTFTAPTNAMLDPGTTYHVVYTEGTTGKSWWIQHTLYTRSGVTTEDGWTFPAAGRNQTGTDAWGTLRGSRTPFMKLEGKIVPNRGVTVTAATTPLTVDESGTGTYTVKLDTQPESTVTITPSSDDPGAATVSGPLTFTTMNWEDAQTVTVTGVQDDDSGDEMTKITHTVSSSDMGYNGIEVDEVEVTVDDDDDRGITVTGSPLTINEGSTGTYTVVLNTQPEPMESVTITPGSSNSDLSFNPPSVMFDENNWNTVRTITVTAGHDDDLEDDSAMISNAVVYVGYQATAAQVSVTITDDDTASITQSTTSLQVAEGGTSSYTLVLDHQPNGTVTVTITQPTNTDVTVDMTTLTFTAANWDMPQEVTVSAAEDTDLDDDDATIVHAVSGANYGDATISDISVDVVDNDAAAGVTVSPTVLNLVEGGESKTYTVKLTSAPTADVTITPIGTGLTISPSDPLVFTTVNWATEQTVTLTAPEDDDIEDATIPISHSISSTDSNYNSFSVASVTANVDDDDVAAVNITPSDLMITVPEGDADGVDYSVVLDKQPNATVTITVNHPTGTDLTIDKTSLTFTTSNWNMAQQVNVKAAEDDDSTDDTATISHTASGGNYAGVTVGSMSVTVDDKDTDGLTISPTTRTIAEGGTESYTVRLNTVPAGNVTVTLTASSGSGVTVPASIMFDTTDWSTPKTVTITAIQDDDAFDNTGTISHSVTGYNAGMVPDVSTTVIDDETQGIVVTDATDDGGGSFSTTVTEGASKTYKLSLASAPYPSTGTVTVGINVPTGTDITASTASLTFTSSDWNTPKDVILTAAEDADAADDTITITHTVNGADYTGVSTPTLDVTISDTDTPNLVFSETLIDVDETDADVMETYTVKLATQPTGAVTVALSSNNSDVEVQPASLDFTTSDWNTAQTVTLTIKHDEDAATDNAIISHTASDADYAGVTGVVAVNVLDDETAGIEVSLTSTTVAEGSSGTFTFKLESEPTAQVTVMLTSDNSDATFGQSSYTFTASNWETAQTVTVNVGPDDDGEDETATITLTASGGDYATVTPKTVTVNITDNDPKGLEFRTSDFNNIPNQRININEGQTKTYGVRLKTQPTGDVEVTPTGSSVKVEFIPPNTVLTFTPMNWNVYQEISIKGAEDDDAHNPRPTIDHTITGYGTLDSSEEPDVINVRINDDESVGSTVDATLVNGFLEVSEGDTTGSTFTVVLTSRPVNSSNGNDFQAVLQFTAPSGLTVSPASLTFGGTNWDEPQTFTVRATDDLNGVDEEHTIRGRFDNNGSDYANKQTSQISIKVIDDEEPGIEISQTAVTVHEGSTTTNVYTVRPTTEPSGEFLFWFVPETGSDVSTGVRNFTFNATNWMVAQPVTLIASQDADAQGDEVTIEHSIEMYDGAREYDELMIADVTVTVDDNDTRGVRFIDTTLDGSTHTISVNEGDTSTYQIRLTSAPYPSTETVTVTINDPTNTDITAEPPFVTFTSSDWNTGQTVTVTMAEDDDTTADSDTITHTISGADYGANSVTAPGVRVDTVDNDTPSVFVSESSVNPTEGSTATYQIKLNTQPTGTVTVSLSSNNSEVTLSDSSLTFTSSTWSTLQTVTVTAAEDADAAEDTATITHSVSGAEYNSAPTPASVAVTVADNDMLEITVAPTTVPINEVDGGTGTGQYMITLSAAPSGGSATIQITKSGDTNVTTNPTSVTFSASEWTTPTTSGISKTVTINVSDDLDAVDDSATLTHAVSGSDYQTEGITADPVTVEVTDTDTAGVTVSVPDITVAEESTGTYTIRLDTQPTGDVVVTINDPSNPVITADPSALTFTAINWNTPQDVTVNALTDPDANDDTGTITHEITSGPGEYPTTMTIASVAVTSTDGNTRGVEITETAVEVEEGISTDTYQVRLDTEPSGPVTITASSDNSDVSTNPTSLTFNSTDWDTYKTFEVSAIDDDDAAADSAVISHTVAGADYGDNNVTAASVDVTVFDGDNASASVSTETLEVTEGQGAGYTIVLDSRPVGGNVTVTLTPPINPDITLDQTTLTFTSSNWNTAQTVTVTAADDPDTQVDTGTIVHAISGANFTGATLPNVAVTVVETSVVAVVIEPTEFDVGEGESMDYTVNLGTLPSGNVTIAVVVKDNPDVTVDPSSLTFTGTDWDEPQTVTVSAAADTDAQNDVASISHTASGFEYAGVTGSDVIVTVIEDGTSVRNTSSFLRSSTCDSKVFLSWNAPVDGDEIATFTIVWSTDDANGEVDISDPAATSYELSGLTNGVEYTIRITGYSVGDDVNNVPREPLWTREIMTIPSDDPCITEVNFGNILADSTPVIVEVGDADAGTQVNMRYRSLNPGVWSEVESKTLPEGESSVTFDIRGLRPSNNYEVQTWLGSSTPPTVDRDDAPEASVTQRIFTTGEAPDGAVFTGGGGSRGGRILRIEPQIVSIAVRPDDEVLLSVDVWGRQNILDNSLADKAPSDGRPEFTWFTHRGGSFIEANIRAEWSNGIPDDRVVVFTAPNVPGTFTVEASIDDSVDCAVLDGENDEQKTARCTAQFQVTVLRRAELVISTTAPVNPAGTIPETLTDSDGVAYAIFTPVEGGSFVVDGYGISAGPGAVANGEFIGVTMTPVGLADDVGQSWHRYTLSGLRYLVGVVDASGQKASEYSLTEAASVCVPLPSELRSNISDVVLAATGDDNFTVLSTSVKIAPDGVQVCGNLSALPAVVAVGKVGPPVEPQDADGEGLAPEEELPDTGGAAIDLMLLMTMLMIGILVVRIGLTVLRRRRLTP